MAADERGPDEGVIDEPGQEAPLGERLLNVLVYAPAGLLLSVAEELPKLALRGRERFGGEVSSARAVGELVVRGGRRELERRSNGLFRHHDTDGGGGGGGGGGDLPQSVPPTAAAGSSVGGSGGSGSPGGSGGSDHLASSGPIGEPAGEPDRGATPASVPASVPTDMHLPTAASLAIPGFDALSASQVVQRLDGMSRQELIAVRTYEGGTRGRRTVLSRVDQLLDERA